MDLNILKAVEILRDGGLVAFPTETVYGLGADASNPLALQRIFAAKGRPVDHPLIVHLGDISLIDQWAVEVPEGALRLAEAFWPGPLTLILKKAASVSDWVTGGQDTIGIRIPNHPVALDLLKAFGGGLAAPSANRFGRISPTTAEAVREELGDAVGHVLDGGQCAVGVESTIVDMSSGHPVVLRPGMITALQIESVLHESVQLTQRNSPRVSGSLESHYAPVTQTVLVQGNKLTQFVKDLDAACLPAAVLCFEKRDLGNGIESFVMSSDAKHYAHDLYCMLRELDKKEFKLIVIEVVPLAQEWDAVRDRLQRAAAS